MRSAFGGALLDHYRDERSAPLIQRDGPETREHPIERFYFGSFDAADELWGTLGGHLAGPMVDLGAGAGRHALHFQEQFETVAVEPDPQLVTLMRERGVEDAREGDMFALRETFDRDRFASALAYGTQVGLAGSMAGLRSFLCDLAHVTRPDGTAVLDAYDPTTFDPDDPTALDPADLLGYRADPAPGLASRVMTFEYEDTVDETLLFGLFSPARFREATVGTDWSVVAVHQDDGDPHYVVVLERSATTPCRR